MTDMGYGRLWWTGKLGNRGFYTALGHGGQYVLVLPEVNMIVVTNSFSELDYETADQHERAVARLIKDHTLPAIR